MQIYRRLGCQVLIALLVLVQMPVHADETDKIAITWVASERIADEIVSSWEKTRQQVTVDELYKDLRPSGSKVGPVVIIVGIVALEFLVDTLIKVYRETKPGTFILVCNGEMKVQSNEFFPANTLTVHNCDTGETRTVMGDEIGSTAGDVDIVKLLSQRKPK